MNERSSGSARGVCKGVISIAGDEILSAYVQLGSEVALGAFVGMWRVPLPIVLLAGLKTSGAGQRSGSIQGTTRL